MEQTAPVIEPSQPENTAPEVKVKPHSYVALFAVIGLLIAGALLTYAYLRPKTTLTPALITQQIPMVKPLFLKLDSLSGSTTAVNDEVLISGTTLPNTTVVIYSDTDASSLESDQKGYFEGTVGVGTNGGLV